MQTGNTVTLTREEVIKAIQDMAEGILQDYVRKYMEGDVDARVMINSYYDIPSWKNEKIMQTWCDMCSDMFFDGKIDVEDVLMATTLPPVNGQILIQKEWLCNKSEYVISKD